MRQVALVYNVPVAERVRPDNIRRAKGVRNEMLQKAVKDHMKGKEDQRNCMEESDIGAKIGVSSGDYQEKKATVL